LQDKIVNDKNDVRDTKGRAENEDRDMQKKKEEISQD